MTRLRVKNPLGTHKAKLLGFTHPSFTFVKEPHPARLPFSLGYLRKRKAHAGRGLVTGSRKIT